MRVLLISCMLCRLQGVVWGEWGFKVSIPREAISDVGSLSISFSFAVSLYLALSFLYATPYKPKTLNSQFPCATDLKPKPETPKP